MEQIKKINLVREPRTAEELFFLYASPCIHNLRELEIIAEEDYKRILYDFSKGIYPLREDLEKIFEQGVEALKTIAWKMNKKDYFDYEVVSKYWREGEHNVFIDNGYGIYSTTPKSFNELCKVYNSEIIEIEDGFLKVSLGGKEKYVLNRLIQSPKKGDLISVHYGEAIERLDSRNFSDFL